MTAGRVATGPLWGRKYDCTEVLLTSFVVRRILGEGWVRVRVRVRVSVRVRVRDRVMG